MGTGPGQPPHEPLEIKPGDEPPYLQIARQLRDRILAGTIEPGSRLPSADAITQETGVAKFTAIKSLRKLEDEGYARIVRGWGTYVAPRGQWPEPPA